MTGRVFIAGLLGGAVLFLWGGVSWMVLGDLHQLFPLSDGDEVVESLGGTSLDGGVYYWPANMEEMGKKPNIHFMVYQPEGSSPMGPPMFIGGILLSVLQAVLAAFLLNIAAPVIRRGYWGRVLFVFWLAVFASLVVHMMYANWMMFPLGYTLAAVGDTLVGWLFAGLVLAAMIRPATSQNPMAATAL